MFILLNGEIFRVLLHAEGGAWVISYEHPLAPLYLDESNLSTAEHIETPEQYIEQMNKPRTAAQRERLSLIEPLLTENIFISDAKARREKIRQIAAEQQQTESRIRKLFFSYLASGVLTKPKPREEKKRPEFEWAIREFYFSSKRYSLKTTYDLLILSKYVNTAGEISEDIPSWSSFKHYYDKHRKQWDKQKTISREGLSCYKRNHRMSFGSAVQWREKVGSFQMDATQADIYVVSEYDRSLVLGRPTIVLAVDVASELIAGISVGMNGGGEAVRSCLSNIAADKVSCCAEYGISISEEQWPCSNVMARELITDQGSEFSDRRMDDFILRYGIERQALPPFRPDDKGLVEKSFDLLQECYKPMLRGKGVIEADAAERWAVDYRKQAKLTLKEFTAVVLRCVVYLNSGRIAQEDMTAASRWKKLIEEKKSNLLHVDAESIYQATLPRTKAKLTKKGIPHQHLYYAPENTNGLLVGDTVTIAYDPQRLDKIYLLRGKKDVIACTLTAACSKYSGYDEEELKLALKNKKSLASIQKRKETEARIAMRKEIMKVIREAEGGTEYEVRR